MERMPEYSYRPEKNSLIERFLSLSEREFSHQTEIQVRDLIRVDYSPRQATFSELTERQPSRGIEVLYHTKSSTLIVPPPTPGSLKIGDLPIMALPVVGFIQQQKPDIVIGCDRGARIYGIAVYSMWGKLNQGRFPTLDRTLHFTRLSTSLGTDITGNALADIINASTNEAKRQGRGFNGKKPRIMFIDDLVASGATRRHIFQSLEDIGVLAKVDTSFALMCGPGGDISGRADQVSIPWHDNPEVIGINYTRDGKVYPIRSEEAKKIRRKVYKATKEVANSLKK